MNRVLLVGVVTQATLMNRMASGSSVAKFKLDTTEKWIDKDGKNQARVEKHNIVVFGKLAETVAERVKFGSTCYIEGSVKTSKWKDNDGIDKFTTEINASRIDLLDDSIVQAAPMPSIPKPNEEQSLDEFFS